MELAANGADLIRRFEDFISSISKTHRVAVLHHTDPDGVCSGVLAAKLIERIRGKKIDLRLNQASTEHKINLKTVKTLKEKKITHLITTDITPGEDPNTVKQIERFAKILVIDHHTIYNDINSKKTIMIKPHNVYKDIEPSKYCSAKLIFDLGSRLCDLSDLDWIAGTGVIGDCTTSQWPKFLTKLFKKYKIKKKKDWFDTSIGKVSVFLSSSEAYSQDNIPDNFKITYNAKKYQDILNNSKLKKFAKSIDDEFNYWVKNIDTLAEHYPKLELIFYFLEPKFNIKSPISTILALKYPHKTLITLSKKDGFVFFSGRRSDFKLPVNKLFEDSVVDLKNSSAGGHTPAAGGKIREEDYAVFKKRLFENIKLMIKKAQ